MIIGEYDYISERAFDEVWGARAKPDGDLYLYNEVSSYPIELVWTISEGEDLDDAGFNVDGNWYASPGIYVVNALGYVITAKPWGHGTRDAIWYLDDDFQARENRRQEFVEQAPGRATD